jgi:crotonobetaine/carnitine-CoA ligase
VTSTAAQFDRLQTPTIGLLAERAAGPSGARPFLRTAAGDRSYAEFDADCERTALSLAEAGVGAGDAVAIYAPNCIEMVQVWFACMKLGAAAAPLNVDSRGRALNHMLDLVGASVVVLHPDVTDLFAEDVAAERSLTCFITDALCDAAPRGSLKRAIDRSTRTPVLILGTSGTTGPSKAVVINSACAAAWAEVIADQLQFTSADVLYCPFPLYHIDATALTVIAALITGGTAAIGARFSPTRFWGEVRAFEATVFNYLGASLMMLAAQPPSPLDRQHRVRLAWGVQRNGLTELFQERYGIPLIEGYGSTEMGCPLWNDLTEPRKEGSCGRARPEYEVAIVDESDRPVGPHVTGEFVVRPRVPEVISDGYLNMPAATTAARRNLWLHTGDLLYMDDDGDFFFVGRNKDMIRRRGQNISAFEVEHAIALHPDVAEVAAIGVPSEMTDEEVAVFVVLRDGARMEPAELLEFARAQMGRHMLPRYVTIADALPRTPTEKCDKQALKARFRPEAAWDRTSPVS